MEDSNLQHMISSKIAQTPTPEELAKAHPLTPSAAKAVMQHRQQIIDCMTGKDKRLMVVVGPCSEDDSIQPDRTPSVVKYAKEIKKLSDDEAINKHLFIVLRCNPAKPRSDLGLAGLEQKDLQAAHRLLIDIANLEMPVAFEVMNTQHLARYGSLLSMAWVGARNIADTYLRHALSAYHELPVFCKNGETGDLMPALQAIKTINASHKDAAIMLPNGLAATVAETAGNPYTGLTWRGGTHNKTPEGFEEGIKKTAETGLPYAVDCAHDNERAHDPASEYQKGIEAQKACINHLVELMEQGNLAKNPSAIMIESYLLEGMDTSQKTPGMSWTDPCISLEDTKAMITHLAGVHAKLTKET